MWLTFIFIYYCHALIVLAILHTRVSTKFGSHFDEILLWNLPLVQSRWQGRNSISIEGKRKVRELQVREFFVVFIPIICQSTVLPTSVLSKLSCVLTIEHIHGSYGTHWPEYRIHNREGKNVKISYHITFYLTYRV